jgi:hypothetical protein
MDDTGFVDMMAAAIAESNGTEAEALVMFELHLLERDDPRLVWELFAPVRLTLLRRLYGMALHQLHQTSEAQPKLIAEPNFHSGTTSETFETADSPAELQSSQSKPRHSTVSTFGPSPGIPFASCPKSAWAIRYLCESPRPEFPFVIQGSAWHGGSHCHTGDMVVPDGAKCHRLRQ